MKQQQKPHLAVVKNWLIGRFGMESAIDFARKKIVPMHKHSSWRYFGWILLTLLVIQVVTGFLLLFYYQPTPETAHESINDIMTKFAYGWLIRSIHSWSATFMIAGVFIHFFCTMSMKSYRLPRELVWITGIMLLFISLAMGFSGYLLPWNERSFFATKVATGLAKKVPIVGKYIFYLLRGSENISGETLTRFFGFHVCILPFLLFLTTAIHIWLFYSILYRRRYIKWLVSPPPTTSSEKTKLSRKSKQIPFFPNFFYRNVIIALAAVGIIVTLAVFLPKELGTKANPLAPAPAGIKPEWYFVFLFTTLKYIPPRILFINGEVFGITVIGLVVVLLFLLPSLEKRARRSKIKRLFTAIAIFLMVYFVALTIIGYIAPDSHQPVTQPDEQVRITPDLNHILALIGFWCVLIFIISFLALKVRHYDELAEQGYWDVKEQAGVQ